MDYSLRQIWKMARKQAIFLISRITDGQLGHIVKDADVLGAFCYTGSFEVHAGSLWSKISAWPGYF